MGAPAGLRGAGLRARLGAALAATQAMGRVEGRGFEVLPDGALGYGNEAEVRVCRC